MSSANEIVKQAHDALVSRAAIRDPLWAEALVIVERGGIWYEEAEDAARRQHKILLSQRNGPRS